MITAMKTTRLPITLAGLSRREKQMLSLCAVCVLGFAAYMISPEDEAAGVELASSPPASAAPAVVQQPASAPAPVPVPAALAAPTVAAPAPVTAVPTVTADGLVLKGVFGGGPRGGSAIIKLASGQDRKVPVGRELAPGVTLKAVGLNHAVITGPDGDKRLDLASGAAAAPSNGAPPSS